MIQIFDGIRKIPRFSQAIAHTDMWNISRFRSAILILSRTAGLATCAIPIALIAQTSPLQFGAVYQCSAAQSFKVLSCSGSHDADLCEVQSGGSKAESLP